MFFAGHFALNGEVRRGKMFLRHWHGLLEVLIERMIKKQKHENARGDGAFRCDGWKRRGWFCGKWAYGASRELLTEIDVLA